MGLALLGVLVVAVLVRLILVRGNEAPWIMVDELLYSESAKSLAAEGELRHREGPAPFLGIYPFLIAPAWLAESMATTYAIAKAINVLLMTLAAVPVFFWARRLVSPLAALIPATLVLIMPAFYLTGLLMTENAFFSAFLLATFAIAVALERPSLLHQGFALAAVGVAVAVRLQALVLLGVLVSAAVLNALLELRARDDGSPHGRLFLRRLSPLWPTGVALVAVVVSYFAAKTIQDESLATGLGSYAEVATVSYDWWDALRWTVYHAAGLGLSVALLPLSALVVLAGLVWRRDYASTAAERAFVAVALSAVVWLTIEVGVFASRFAFRIEERTLFHVAPLLLIALVLWIQRGAPRPRLLGAIASLIPAALLIAFPFESLLNVSLLSDAFSLIPLLELAGNEGVVTVRIVVASAAILLAVLFFSVPVRMLAWAVPALVASFFVGWSYVVQERLDSHSEAVRGVPVVGDRVSWVDEELGEGANVAFLYTSNVDPHALWQTEFWNRAIGPVVNIGQRELGPLVETATTIDYETGELVPVAGQPLAAGTSTATHVLTPRTHPLQAPLAAQRGPWSIFVAEPPVRLAAATDGVAADGWMGADASYTHFVEQEDGGRIGVRLSRFSWSGPDVPGEIRVRVGDLVLSANGAPRIGRLTSTATGTIHAGQEETFLLETPPPPFRVEIHIEPTFSPASFGFADTRQLGAIASFVAFSGER
jgi:hypothetical protein